jgi:hypothetical protein
MRFISSSVFSLYHYFKWLDLWNFWFSEPSMGKCENCGRSLSNLIANWSVVPRNGASQEIVSLYLSSNLNSNFNIFTFWLLLANSNHQRIFNILNVNVCARKPRAQ